MPVNGNNGSTSYDATYFGSLGVKHIPKEIKKFKVNKNIHKKNSIQTQNSIMCGYFFIGFIFMLKGKTLLDYINLFFS